MKIRIIDPSQKTKRLRDLDEGDWFVRWANPRKLHNCVVYMKLHPHTRLENYGRQHETVPTVALDTGRITNMEPEQKLLQVVDDVEVEIAA